MSAPDTNTDRQQRRHRGAIWGIAIAVLLGLGATALMLLDTTDGEEPPAETAAGAPEAPTE
ncbi:hypothetical protein [Oceanicola sp. S124]|uniref:hypothetical protein n=1 Tax=Oceanicola sp. S124 TaxID=1042378 RepID=UPI0002557D17|nr:hypothetical protein [Oceanicola sp. S124]